MRVRLAVLGLISAAALIILWPPAAGARHALPSAFCVLDKLGIRHPATACRRPFSRTSPFNRPVRRHPNVAANSAHIVKRVVGWGPPAASYAGAAGTLKDWSHPVYFGRPSNPVYTIHQTGSWANPDIEGRRIHIPASARPAGGADAAFSVVEPDGWEYDFWRARRPGRNGGRFTADFGRRGRWDGDGLGTSRPPHRGGTTAAAFSNAAGIIRVSEMKAGVIPHALFMSVNCYNGDVWPADTVGTSGRCSDPRNAPAMGQHFWLDMSRRRIDRLSVPLWQKIILRAMAKYGMYVGDDGGAAWALQIESGDNYTSFGKRDPWVTYAKAHGIHGSYDSAINRTLYHFNLQHAVNWGRNLKVLAPGRHHHRQ